jgi:hypothetical protein
MGAPDNDTLVTLFGVWLMISIAGLAIAHILDWRSR